jgi:hypothetical protein
MKGTIPAILVTLFIVATCIFISCNASKGIMDQENTPSDSDTSNYTEIINDLKNQIIELKQNQYISEIEREQEIKRLESLISALEGNTEKSTESTSETESSTSEKDSDSGTDSSASETESDTEKETSIGKFSYTAVDGGIAITGYDGNVDELVIPSSIDGMTVIAISDSAFASMSIKSASVPDTVTKIGWFAFKDCKHLRSVSIPKNVKSIGYSAFSNTSDSLIFICEAESFAAKYAESYGIRYATM